MSDELDLSLIARCGDFEIDGGGGAQRQGIDFQGGSLNGTDFGFAYTSRSLAPESGNFECFRCL